MNRSNIAGISYLKQLFQEQRQYFTFVKVVKTSLNNSEGGSVDQESEIAEDGSSYLVRVLTEYGDETTVKMGMLPSISSQARVNDLWLACFIDGNRSDGVLIAFLHNEQCPMHPKTREGETVISSLKEKNINLSNNHAAGLSEPAVLGNVLTSWLENLSDEIKKIGSKVDDLKSDFNAHTHSNGNMGAPTGPPISTSSVSTQTERAAIDTLKSDAETSKYKSDLVFIQEKGLN